MLNSLVRNWASEVSDSNGRPSPIDIEAANNLLRGLEAHSILAKIRALNLIMGDWGVGIRRNILPDQSGWEFVNSYPNLFYKRTTGLSVQGDPSTFIPTGFNPTAANLSYSNWSRGVYVVDPGPNRYGTLLGVQDNQNGNSSFVGSQDDLSIFVGYKLRHTKATGLMSITGDRDQIRSMTRYLVEDAQPNGLDPNGFFDAESVLLNDWAGGGWGQLSDATIGAYFESAALTVKEMGILSGLLDRFHLQIGRTKGAQVTFFGAETMPVFNLNSWPRQMAGRLNLPFYDATAYSSQWTFDEFPDAPPPPGGSNGYGRAQSELIDLRTAFKVILWGTRDVLMGEPYNPTRFGRLLKAMIDTMLEAGILAQNIVLGTVPDISDQALTDHGVDRSRLVSYVRACRDVAVETGVRLVDCYEATRDRPELFVSNQGFEFDGIALSDAGHQVLADLFVKSFLTPIVPGGATVVPLGITEASSQVVVNVSA